MLMVEIIIKGCLTTQSFSGARLPECTLWDYAFPVYELSVSHHVNLGKLHYPSKEIHFAHCMTVWAYLRCKEQIGKFKNEHPLIQTLAF